MFVLCCLLNSAQAEEFKLFEYIQSSGSKMVCYSASGLDPRSPANALNLKTSSLEADLKLLRPAFDGLILYGYDSSSTPRILYLAKQLGYKAVILGIWNIKETAEIDGVAKLADQYAERMAIGIMVGNEGLTFGRYEPEDLHFAVDRLKSQLKSNIPLSTSEPLVGYQHEFLLQFGDFLAPNIHPVFDRPDFEAKEAAHWARNEAMKLAKKSTLPLLLKETGFPHGGKPQFTSDTQAAFWKSYLAEGKIITDPTDNNWVYYGVAFEAYDLTWKAAASGMPIESEWGMLSPMRKPYPVFEIWRDLK
ncbi:MAG: exo-beta-1,3-glucanase [Blastopirellula sp.]|nr:MAG: exo-beta-1,3-glucanase [Blastopirellula sp.]